MSISSSCLPCSLSVPSTTTTMRSESLMVLSRWAMVKVVRPVRTLSRASCTWRSDTESKAEVASSSSSTSGSRMIARAMAQRCFWPPLRRPPRKPTLSFHFTLPWRA
mmetsp:Transcript_29515/g.94071  ORF Transcript_29515/g.94071 Transcript_29515/m.94071 type:complete len:107 (+) Transcript_29515:59-379(+)